MCHAYIEKVLIGIGLLQSTEDLDDAVAGILLAN